jgi:hypothetical protein
MRGKTNKNTLARSAKELREGSKKKTRLKVKVQSSSIPKKPKAKQPSAKIKRSQDYPSAEEVIQRARSEREKKIVMWSGVSILMLVIVFFWVVNTKELIGSSAKSGDDSGLSDVWQETQKELEAGFLDFQENLETIKEASQTEEAVAESDEPENRQESNELEDKTPASLPDNYDISELEEELSNQ